MARAKRAWTTRRVDVGSMRTLITGNVRPNSGDLILARVDEVRKQKRLELPDGRKALLFPGDEIIVCYGNRYAPDQYEAVVGVDLSPCDLVAAGGVAGRELSRNLRILEPTRISPIGLLGDGKSNRLNVRSFSIPSHDAAPAIPTVLSLGTSMNAGKTLTATSLVRGLKKAGLKVAAIKATGTGSGNDMWIVRDAGADVTLDFTDAGFSGTYLIPQAEIEQAVSRLIRHAGTLGCDIAIVEIADGLQHLETAALIEASHMWSSNLGVVFAAYDAMGAKCGVDILRELGHTVLGVSGRIALSPLAMREAERTTGLRVYTPADLQEGALVDAIRERAGLALPRALPLAVGAASAASEVALYAREPRPHPTADDRAGPAADRPDRSSIVLLPQARLRRADRQDGRQPASASRSALGILARWVMAVEVEALCRAPTGARTNRRNGYRRLLWDTSLGEVELRVPRVRKGGYHPSFLAPSPQVDLVAVALNYLDAVAGALEPLVEFLGSAGVQEADLAELKGELDRAIWACAPFLAERRPVLTGGDPSDGFSGAPRAHPDSWANEDDEEEMGGVALNDANGLPYVTGVGFYESIEAAGFDAEAD